MRKTFRGLSALCALATVLPITAQAAETKPKPIRPQAPPVSRPAPQTTAPRSYFRVNGYAPLICNYTTFGAANARYQRGILNLGPVKETCNSVNPYTVSVSLGNVYQGYLMADGQAYPIQNGEVAFQSHFVGTRTTNWSLRNATLYNINQSVNLSISIIGQY